MSIVANSQHEARAGSETAPRLLDWYDSERRDLPWRYQTGEHADPYLVWLSEIMLQQTTVKAVIPYFDRFVAAWPNIQALAEADEESVLQAWAGLGYYSRARNLHNCAKIITSQFEGHFPQSERQLEQLPGIGPYTAAAISAIAFGRRATPVDSNVERVVARLFAVEEPLPQAKSILKDLASTLTPTERTGDFAQAMMDLGATICTPRRPSCLMCPLQDQCVAKARGIAPRLPAKSVKPERPTRFGYSFVALAEDGALLLRQRPDTGLLARMLEVPSTPWQEDLISADDAKGAAPVRSNWWQVPGPVVHTFTHFRLETTVYRAIVPPNAHLTFWADSARCRWVPRAEIDRQALPTVMRKIIAHALKNH
ncbi:MAG: A/G-specific adenine glycosylase [Hyphomicrobiaceae bacterium]